MFQHTAARRRLVLVTAKSVTKSFLFQHTAARRRLGATSQYPISSFFVSTHSRPKAAGIISGLHFFDGSLFQHTAARRRLAYEDKDNEMLLRFNTQPPEGGWVSVNLEFFHY